MQTKFILWFAVVNHQNKFIFYWFSCRTGNIYYIINEDAGLEIYIILLMKMQDWKYILYYWMGSLLKTNKFI